MADTWQKKRHPLSTGETMEVRASPRLKPCRPVLVLIRFTVGLVAGLFWPSDVSGVDTFIEKPSFGAALVQPADLLFPSKQVTQVISFSVEG